MSGDQIDHAAAAREILERLTPMRDTGPGLGMGYWSSHEGAQVSALRGIGHALLAIHEALSTSATTAPHVTEWGGGAIHAHCPCWDEGNRCCGCEELPPPEQGETADA